MVIFRLYWNKAAVNTQRLIQTNVEVSFVRPYWSILYISTVKICFIKNMPLNYLEQGHQNSGIETNESVYGGRDQMAVILQGGGVQNLISLKG